MTIDPITGVLNLGKTFLDKFVADKDQRMKLEHDFELFALQETTKQDGIFREFVLQYEGAAKDVPKIVVLFRSLIRPVFTVAVGYFDYIFFTGNTTTWAPEAIGLLKAVNVIVLAFWFGERAVKNSGIIEMLLEKKKTNN
jgi:hypothetical protein